VSPPFNPAQLAALRQLHELWADSIPFVLIGATAIRCQRDMPRETNDLDVTIAVSMDRLPAGLDTIPGWRRDARREHEWTGPGSVHLDLLPASPELVAAGYIDWPSGHRMSLFGFGHVFDRCVRISIAEDLEISVAHLAVISLLKMVSYLDRPSERERDLADIGLLIEEYVCVDDEQRWSDEVVAEKLSFDLVSVFALGRDMAAFLTRPELELVERFVAAIEENRYGALVRMAVLGPFSLQRDEDQVRTRLAAFRRGLATMRLSSRR
jgi:predicted nucleotidyltransferase